VNRILIVAPQPFFSVRGTPINARALAETLAEAGYQVTILTLPYGEDIDIPGVQIVRVPKLPFFSGVPIGASFAKLSYLVVFCLYVFKMVRRDKFQVLHGIEEGAFAVGLTGLLKRIPYVVDIDSCMPTQLKESSLGVIPGVVSLFYKIESFFLKRAAAAITVCEALTEKVRAVDSKIKVFQIEDFPFGAALEVDAAKLQNLKTRFPSGKTFLYTGNLESYQGVELLIKSFSLLKDHPARLLIVGGPSDKIPALKTLALQLGVSSSVIFEGARPAEEMGAYMNFADYLVSPRLAGENVPLKLYTYLAAGKPLIATRIRSHTQIVSDETAILGEPFESSFTEALRRVLRRELETSEILQRASALVTETYSHSAFKRRVIAAYSEIAPLKEHTFAAIIEDPEISGTEDPKAANLR